MDLPQNDLLALADWRRQVSEMYAAVRRSSDPNQAWCDFRARRDRLFLTHPQTPLTAVQRSDFSHLNYFDYNPNYRVMARVDGDVESQTFSVKLIHDGLLRFTTIARLFFDLFGQTAALNLYWVNGYGGGLFLPFRDKTNGMSTYGGGRYLYDTIKGADISLTADQFVLDFNFAYNPSCAYNEAFSCPLPPRENWVQFAIEAGEKHFKE